MVTNCWRCGVAFDASQFIEGAPCADCQLDEPENEWVKFGPWKQKGQKSQQYSERLERHIMRLHKRRYSDSEIGAAIGLTADAVAHWRRRHGVPAHSFMGDEKWRNPEKVLRDLSERMMGNRRNRFGQFTKEA